MTKTIENGEHSTSADPAAERLDVAVLLPRPEKVTARGLAPSDAALSRRKEVRRSHGSEVQPQVWRPETPVAGVFQKLGFDTPAAAHRAMSKSVQSGTVQSLDSLGGYIVYERRGRLRIDDLLQEFGRDFVIARDIRVFQQGSGEVKEAGSPESEGMAWNEDTGINHARERKVTGKGVRFGVVDTGIDATHKDFLKRTIPFLNVPYREDEPPIFGRRGFDNSGHGSHIASVIAGRDSGIARRARLHMAAVAEGHSLTSHMRRIVRGLDWLYDVFRGPDHRGSPIIVNLSLGFPNETPPNEDNANYHALLDVLRAAIELMIDENMLVVAAIGNDEAGRFRYPAALPEVLAVGAVDEDGEEIKQFSGSVPAGTADLAGPDLVGIGENVLGANACNVWGDSLYARWAGTSQATAYVSGIAGLYWSMNPRLSAADIRNLLIGTAKPVPPRQSSDRWGAGLARFDPPKELLKEHEGS